jgi:hypothetical protein
MVLSLLPAKLLVTVWPFDFPTSARQQVGTGISREGLISLLRDAQAKADKQLPDDDLRVVDDGVFIGAIPTFDANQEAQPERVLKVYLESLGGARCKVGTLPARTGDAEGATD